MIHPGSVRLLFCSSFRFSKGITLVEMVAVIAIVAITSSIALPGFDHILSSNQQTTSINRFSTSLAQARYYAISYYSSVVLCPSSNLTDCTGGYDWQNGYITFEDDDMDRQRDPNEKIIAVTQKQPNAIQIQTSTGRKKITFHPSGGSLGSNATVKVCSKISEIPGKALILSNTGRARLAKKLPNGEPVTCNSG